MNDYQRQDREKDTQLTEQSERLVKRKLLTDGIIRRLTPRGKEYYVKDAEVSNLEVRVFTTGAKRFSVRVKVKGERKQRRITLGNPDKMTVDEARDASL